MWLLITIHAFWCREEVDKQHDGSSPLRGKIVTKQPPSTTSYHLSIVGTFEKGKRQFISPNPRKGMELTPSYQ